MATKIYIHNKFTEAFLKLKVGDKQVPVSFVGGVDLRSEGFTGGKFITDDEDIQKAIEARPEYESGLIQTHTKDKEESKPQEGWVTIEDSNVNAASKRMTEMFDDVEFKHVQGKENLLKVAEEKKVKLPNIK